MKNTKNISKNQLPLVVIVGPTASGKTSLAIDIAKKFNGEIICADSRTVYKGLDIGTAKPSLYEQNTVKHWIIDLCSPNEKFSAYEFKKLANSIIKEIRDRNKIPIIVGGTGLYVDAVLYDYEFPNRTINNLNLESMDLDSIIELCVKSDIKLPQNYKNRRHLINYFLRDGKNGSKQKQIRKDAIVVGIATDRLLLKQRITRRTDQMLKNGVIKEATMVAGMYGWDAPGLSGNVYPSINQYLRGDGNLEDLRLSIIKKDMNLAKRQMTWFRRNSQIKWLNLDDASVYLESKLE